MKNVKILFDIIYIALSVAVCLIFLGELAGVREGSIIAAVAVGMIIKLYNRLFEKLVSRRSAK